MKNIWRKIKKEKLYIICLQISFISATVVLFLGISIYSNIYAENMEKNNYKYTFETTAFTNDNITDDDYIKKLQSADCNVKIINFSGYSDAEKTTTLTDIIINSYEENYPFIEGGMENIKKGERNVILGIANKEYIYQKDGEDYFDIFGEAYKVCGYISSEKSVSFDYKIIVDYDGIGDVLKQRIADSSQMGIELILESNKRDTDEIFYTLTYELGLGLLRTESEVFLASTGIYNEKVYCIIIYFFCFVCIYTVLQYYLKNRQKEIVIRKINGFSKKKIIVLLYKNIFINFIAAYAVGMCIVLALVKLLEALKKYNLQISIQNMVILIGIFMLSIILVSIKPVYNLVKTDPITFLYIRSESMRRKKEKKPNRKLKILIVCLVVVILVAATAIYLHHGEWVYYDYSEGHYGADTYYGGGYGEIDVTYPGIYIRASVNVKNGGTIVVDVRETFDGFMDSDVSFDELTPIDAMEISGNDTKEIYISSEDYSKVVNSEYTLDYAEADSYMSIGRYETNFQKVGRWLNWHTDGKYEETINKIFHTNLSISP